MQMQPVEGKKVIGLIDVDNYGRLAECFPNLALMKIAAFHKSKGDSVSWYEPLLSRHMDIVYKSKVFSFTPDFNYPIDAEKIIQGGSGYAITLEGGRENFHSERHANLPEEIEHIYPDYSMYGIKDTAYGFLSRGCPRGCSFCHVAAKEGQCSRKVADLSEFWNGQKNIEVMDPNILACRDWKELLEQLAESKSWIDFNQGLDIRLMTSEKAEVLRRIKVKQVHFAWDRYQDGDIIKPRLETFIRETSWNRKKVSCYVLCNFDTTMEQNIERINFLRDLDINPYVMLYDKENIPEGHELRQLQRYCNNKIIFWSCKSFDEYRRNE